MNDKKSYWLNEAKNSAHRARNYASEALNTPQSINDLFETFTTIVSLCDTVIQRIGEHEEVKP